MDHSKPLSARQISDLTGIRESDLGSVKPGAPPRINGPVSLGAPDANTLNIDMKDKDGNRLGLKLVREGNGFTIDQGEYQSKGSPPTVIEKPDDAEHVGKAMSNLRADPKNTAGGALTQSLQESKVLRSGQFAGEWVKAREVENFHAHKSEPMKFERPPHMKNASPLEVAAYHLQGFTKTPMPDGTVEFKYTSADKDPETLKLRIDKQGVVKDAALESHVFENGNFKPVKKVLPTTEETRLLVVEAAKDCRTHSVPGQTKTNPNISSTMTERLNGKYRDHGLPRMGHEALGQLQAKVEAPAATPHASAAPAAKPAVAGGSSAHVAPPARVGAPAPVSTPRPVSQYPAAPRSTPSAMPNRPTRGFATVMMMSVTAAVTAIAIPALKNLMPEKEPEAGGERISMSALDRSLQGLHDNVQASPSVHAPEVATPHPQQSAAAYRSRPGGP